MKTPKKQKRFANSSAFNLHRMKKNLLILVLLGILPLAGCFEKKGATGTTTSESSPPPAEATLPPQAEPPSPMSAPTFKDGDLYLEAVSKNDVTLCAKIVNEAIQQRCKAKVQEKKS